MDSIKSTSKKFNRFGLMVNYICLVLIVLIIMLNRIHQWHYAIIPLGIISVGLFTWSFVKIFWMSGAWKYTHLAKRKPGKPDLPGFIAVYRLSYQIYTIAIGLVLLAVSLSDIALHIMVVAALIYYAHILPATILLWKRE